MGLFSNRSVMCLAFVGWLVGCRGTASPPIDTPQVPGTEEPPPSPPPAPAVDPTSLVNPFIGTQNFGNTFPGASAPFGMVQLSPDTGGQGGYDYQQDSIYGFSLTHLSGVGCGVMGEVPIMPTTGALETVDVDGYKSKYSHEDEQATPGYYREIGRAHV